jgi:hypothetical protein
VAPSPTFNTVGNVASERRGGREPGTPNKKTALVNAALDAATSNPDLSPLDFLLEVMRDSSIPPDWRIKAALAALTYVHSKPERAPATDPTATARQIEGGSDSDPLSDAVPDPRTPGVLSVGVRVRSGRDPCVVLRPTSLYI